MATGNMRFGNLVASRRKELRLSQTEVGAAVGVTQSAVSRWELGEIEGMTPGDIHRLAVKLEVPDTVVANALGYPILPEQDATSPTDAAWLAQLPRNLDDDTWALIVDFAKYQADRAGKGR